MSKESLTVEDLSPKEKDLYEALRTVLQSRLRPENITIRAISGDSGRQYLKTGMRLSGIVGIGSTRAACIMLLAGKSINDQLY